MEVKVTWCSTQTSSCDQDCISNNNMHNIPSSKQSHASIYCMAKQINGNVFFKCTCDRVRVEVPGLLCHIEESWHKCFDPCWQFTETTAQRTILKRNGVQRDYTAWDKAFLSGFCAIYSRITCKSLYDSFPITPVVIDCSRSHVRTRLKVNAFCSHLTYVCLRIYLCVHILLMRVQCPTSNEGLGQPSTLGTFLLLLSQFI